MDNENKDEEGFLKLTEEDLKKISGGVEDLGAAKRYWVRSKWGVWGTVSEEGAKAMKERGERVYALDPKAHPQMR